MHPCFHYDPSDEFQSLRGALRRKNFPQVLCRKVVEICAFIIAWRELSGSPIGVFEHCCLQPKMSLQLYQVDQKSYLLDFKSLVDEDNGNASLISLHLAPLDLTLFSHFPSF